MDKSGIALRMFSHSRVREELLSSNFDANGTLGQHTVRKNMRDLITTACCLEYHIPWHSCLHNFVDCYNSIKCL